MRNGYLIEILIAIVYHRLTGHVKSKESILPETKLGRVVKVLHFKEHVRVPKVFYSFDVGGASSKGDKNIMAIVRLTLETNYIEVMSEIVIYKKESANSAITKEKRSKHLPVKDVLFFMDT